MGVGAVAVRGRGAAAGSGNSGRRRRAGPRGCFSDKGYKSPAQALSDLFSWELRAAEPWPPNDPDTGRLVSQVPKEGEADIVRELFERLAQRHSLRRIEQDFAARGILNESGTPFSELFRATS